MVILSVEFSSIMLEIQVNFTVTLMSLTLARITVQVRLRAVPDTMGTLGFTGCTITVGGGTRKKRTK